MTRIARVLTAYRADLSVAIHPLAGSARVGSHVSVLFELTNDGSVPIDGCVGPAKGIAFKGTCSRWLQTLVDHPYCDQRFSLQPGQRYTWTSDVYVEDPGPGAVMLSAWVQVVNPNDCDEYGCYDVKLNSREIPFFISQ